MFQSLREVGNAILFCLLIEQALVRQNPHTNIVPEISSSRVEVQVGSPAEEFGKCYFAASHVLRVSVGLCFWSLWACPWGWCVLALGQASGMAESEYWKIQISFLDPQLPLVCPA